MNPVPQPAEHQLSWRDYLPAALFGIAITAFHILHGRKLAASVLLESYNWVFDLDSARFVGGWCGDLAGNMGPAFLARHALSLATRPFCLGLTTIVDDPRQALMLLTALCAGCAAAIAYLLACRFCAAFVDRFILACAFAVSAQPLMLGVTPETYGFALAGNGLHLLLIAGYLGTAPKLRASVIVSFALNAGFTVTNAILNVVSSIVLAWNRMPLRHWLAVETRTWLWAGIALLAVVTPLAAYYDSTLFVKSSGAPKAIWWIINMNRGEAAGLVRVITSFVLFDFVAPAFTLVNLPAPDSHVMLDFREVRYGLPGTIALALWMLGMVLGVMLAWREENTRRLLVICLTWLLANIVLHWHWQGNGSVYLYGAHTAFTMFAILVVGYAIALRRFPVAAVRSTALLMVCLTAFNNIALYESMIEFLTSQSH